jgi:hypothetical protein
MQKHPKREKEDGTKHIIVEVSVIDGPKWLMNFLDSFVASFRFQIYTLTCPH